MSSASTWTHCPCQLVKTSIFCMQVAEEVRQQKLDLTETEFALLLQACARGSASWQTVQGLLLMMTKELTRLQPETLAAAEQYFRSAAVL